VRTSSRSKRNGGGGLPVVRWSAADVSYDDTQHRSWLPDGSEVPHVTAILGAVGVTTNFDDLAAISARTAAAIDEARWLGSAVHADCHALDDDDLEWASLDPRVEPYVCAWRQCKTDMRLHPVVHERERRVFHALHNYAGIMDGVCRRWHKGRWMRILFDLKTGDPEACACDLQTAAYQLAYESTGAERIDERWAVQLVPERRVPYRIEPYPGYEAPLHAAEFLACLTVYRRQQRRLRRAA
jgi:hypothetical protein